MVNTNYKIEAIRYLLHENCILQGYYPLIPYKELLTERLMQMGCTRKNEATQLTDEELLHAGLPDMGLVGLFRKFLVMYDPKPQKLREINSVSKTPEEAEVFSMLYLLPGVKSTRARLYMQAGFDSLEKIAETSPEDLIGSCEAVITRECLVLKAPLLKEARTHIAVARAFTDGPGIQSRING